MWFSEDHFRGVANKPTYLVPNLRGYVLPHAGTEYTHEICEHTLQFRPSIYFDTVLIAYYPALPAPNVENEYHEFWVVRHVCEYLFRHWWKLDHNITFLGMNVRDDQTVAIPLRTTLFVISSDFSHYQPFAQAIAAENRAAHALEMKLFDHPIVQEVVDDPRTYKWMFEVLPPSITLEWIGRTRSPGKKAVGYLTFLLIDENIQDNRTYPDGVFITCYDRDMRARECLGQWGASLDVPKLFKDVVTKAGTTSRLTGGAYLHVPLQFCTVTYLYRSEKPFIRGWHGVKAGAFYLPDVFLEHTFENGEWIDDTDMEWASSSSHFDMAPTLAQLAHKAGDTAPRNNNYELFERVEHHIKI